MSTSAPEALPGELDIKRQSHSNLYISASLVMPTRVLEAMPGKLEIKRHSHMVLKTLNQKADDLRISYVALEKWDLPNLFNW